MARPPTYDMFDNDATTIETIDTLVVDGRQAWSAMNYHFRKSGTVSGRGNYRG